MKIKSNIVFAILALVLLGSCSTETIRVSGEVTSVTYNFSDYDVLNVSDDFNVFVRFSPTEEEIRVEANADLQEKIIVRKEGNVLTIKFDRNLNVRGNATQNVYITTASITQFKGFGDVEIDLENILIAENIKIELFGDSNFEGEIATKNLTLSLRGDSDMNIFGNADDVVANLQGDSTFRDYDLSTLDLDIDLSGDSDAYLSVSESIKIRASGDSRLYYKGNPEIVRQRLTGDSKLIKR
ncbi:head GIN domain-containing protein [Maribacter sp. 2210JD10-5]|uniref:head GIN domain-containing protein n=1 Tax=Maribacter sp. 2210JD10-5 TaxID=3386272 RepID=UPI0039BCE862